MAQAGNGIQPDGPPDKDWSELTLLASSADYYFNSYNHYGVHEDMLKDAVTSQAYQKAILQNQHLFRGAVVLDVGCGLGVLSLFAAKAGAKKVIGIESQEELVMMARANVAANGFADTIEMVQGDALSLESLPGGLDTVDIIISDWMGYFLMYESRLSDVLAARDKWLKKPGGLIFPDRATMHLELVEEAEQEEYYEYFNDVWGFDFTPMKAPAYREPVVNAFDASQLCSTHYCVMDLDLYTCTADDCFGMASAFTVTCKRHCTMHGLLTWFEVKFDSCHKPISINTSPQQVATCWKQVAFLSNPPSVTVKPGDKVSGMIAVRKPCQKKRDLEMKIQWRLNSGPARIQFHRWG